MIWIALDVPPPWSKLVITGVFGVLVFGVLGVMVFNFSLQAYHRRYFFDKALKLAFCRTLAWLVLNGGSFLVIFWLISVFFPTTSGWLLYLIDLVGLVVWNFLSDAGMGLVDYLLEKC